MKRASASRADFTQPQARLVNKLPNRRSIRQLRTTSPPQPFLLIRTFRAIPIKQITTMAPKKYIQTAADIEMKPHYQCSAAECRKEMTAAGTPPHQDLSISELRVMLRESRIRRGLLQVKEPGQDQMARIKKANKSELQELAKAYKLSSMEKATVGELKLALRQAVIDDCDGDTKINFGKHQGATFMEVMSTDHQYAMWATREVKTSESPDWKLIQFARWVNKMENVEEPLGNTPFMASGIPMAAQSPQSGATGEAPLAWAGLVVAPGQNRHLTQPGRYKAAAPMPAAQGPNDLQMPQSEAAEIKETMNQMMLKIHTLESELKEAKEEAASASSKTRKTSTSFEKISVHGEPQ